MFRGDSPNLILTGFMGTGKSAVGRELARRQRASGLAVEFVDMDALIEAREGKTIAEVFQERGEPYFRHQEAVLCRELAARSGLVIATGGGALIPDANREILSASGPVVCLSASLEEIMRRLAGVRNRPLLGGADCAPAEWRARIAALLAERSEVYARIPLQVDTTGMSIAQVADAVVSVSEASSVGARRAQHAGPRSSTILVRHPGGAYPIYLGSGLLGGIGMLFQELDLGRQVALVTTPPVGDEYAAGVVESLVEAGFEVDVCTVPDGEAYKTLDTVRLVYDCLVDAGLDRSGVVVALGGGVVGDMAGLAAATYLRGVRFVQVPTSLLAMVDSSVGGKVAVDHPRGKNLIGAFKQPEAVIIDTQTLSTLPAEEFASGMAEVVKTGLIGDPDLFEQIEAHGPAPLPWIIERAVRVKAAVVEEDPYERGRRAVLNLGHTFGHALELLSHYQLSHGEGVSIGMVAAARLSMRLGFCDPELPGRIEALLARLDLPTECEDDPAERRRSEASPAPTTSLRAGPSGAAIWEAMASDKKRQGKRLRFILMRAIGDVFVTDAVEREDVLAVLRTLGTT
jgi:3-dehydroquinate synthase